MIRWRMKTAENLQAVDSSCNGQGSYSPGVEVASRTRPHLVYSWSTVAARSNSTSLAPSTVQRDTKSAFSEMSNWISNPHNHPASLREELDVQARWSIDGRCRISALFNKSISVDLVASRSQWGAVITLI